MIQINLLQKLEGYKTIIGSLLFAVTAVLFSTGKIDEETRLALNGLATAIISYGFYDMVKRNIEK